MATIEEIYKHIHFPTAQDKALASMLHLDTIFERQFEAQLVPFGITVPQFRILRILRSHLPEGIAIYTLPRYLPERKSDVSRMLVRMEKAGWVKRQQNAKDKRITYASITGEGIELLKKIDAQGKNIHIQIKNLTTEQATRLNELLQVLVDEFHNPDPQTI